MVQDVQAVRVALNLADDGHAGLFHATLEPADAREQAEDVHSVTLGDATEEPFSGVRSNART